MNAVIDNRRHRKLDLHEILTWMEQDGLVDKENAHMLRTIAVGSAYSKKHPLQIIAERNWKHPEHAQLLTLSVLTEWLAGRVGLPYERIDPLKIDVEQVHGDPLEDGVRRREQTAEHQKQRQGQAQPKRYGVEQIERATDEGSQGDIGFFTMFVGEHVGVDELWQQPGAVAQRGEQADGYLAVGQAPDQFGQHGGLTGKGHGQGEADIVAHQGSKVASVVRKGSHLASRRSGIRSASRPR
jgi:hypothetical protein